MSNKREFDSENCNVRYIEKDKVVLLTWKKFARLDDYRKPTLFASDLMKAFPNSQLVVDARNGFEDDHEDVTWAFSELLPSMAKSTCKAVVFIMSSTPDLQGEMDMWTKEFAKYFAVIHAQSYEQAISKLKSRIIVTVRYTVMPGMREAFLEKVNAQGIAVASRAEPGNYQYDYFKPLDSEDVLFLLEMWVSNDDLEAHSKTAHYAQLQVLKEEFVTAATIEKYTVV